HLSFGAVDLHPLGGALLQVRKAAQRPWLVSPLPGSCGAATTRTEALRVTLWRRWQDRCYTVPYAIGSRHPARRYGTHREDGFYQLSPRRRAMGVGGLRELNSAWLRRIHRLRWHRQW